MVSDYQGNVYSMLNQKTNKLHAALMLMEMLLQLHTTGLQLAPSHVKRDLNTWADELTHPDFSGFTKSLEVCECSTSSVPFDELCPVWTAAFRLAPCPILRARAGRRMGRQAVSLAGVYSWRHFGVNSSPFLLHVKAWGPGTHRCLWP